MPVLRRVARPALAAVFIFGGINELRNADALSSAVKPVLDQAAPAIDKVVENAPLERRPEREPLVKVDAGVKIVAGSLLALGKFPRLSATALAASLVPTTLAGHRFWEETDQQKRANEQIHFLKNVGLLGGLLIAAADTHGKPSHAYRTRKAAERAQARLSGSGSDTGAQLAADWPVRAPRSPRPPRAAGRSWPGPSRSTARSCASAPPSGAARPPRRPRTCPRSPRTRPPPGPSSSRPPPSAPPRRPEEGEGRREAWRQAGEGSREAGRPAREARGQEGCPVPQGCRAHRWQVGARGREAPRPLGEAGPQGRRPRGEACPRVRRPLLHPGHPRPVPGREARLGPGRPRVGGAVPRPPSRPRRRRRTRASAPRPSPADHPRHPSTALRPAPRRTRCRGVSRVRSGAAPAAGPSRATAPRTRRRGRPTTGERSAFAIRVNSAWLRALAAAWSAIRFGIIPPERLRTVCGSVDSGGQQPVQPRDVRGPAREVALDQGAQRGQRPVRGTQQVVRRGEQDAPGARTSAW